MNTDTFANRRDAGQRLAQALAAYRGRADLRVLALPRGGVPVAFEVARALEAPLDIVLVRKLGVPRHSEFAMGAIASGGVRVLNHDVVQALAIPPDIIEAVAEREQQELVRREQRYRGDRPPPDVRGQTVILVDDGLATGATMTAALQAVRAQQPARLVVAVPVGAPDTIARLRTLADDVVSVLTPDPLHAVGNWYRNFDQTSDEEVCTLLAAAPAGDSTGGR